MHKLPNAALYYPATPRVMREVFKEPLVVRCTLGELERAVAAEPSLGVYECSQPTMPRPGKRWLTRAPRFWEAHSPINRPIFLCEVSNVVVDRAYFSCWWCLDIDSEAACFEVLKQVYKVDPQAARDILRRMRENSAQ